MSSAFDPQGQAGQRAGGSEERHPEAGPPSGPLSGPTSGIGPSSAIPQRAHLEQVLHETLAKLGEGGETDTADMAALHEVAVRHRDRPFGLDPVAVDLVRAVLGQRFQSLLSSDSTWQEMVRQIAQTLFEDAPSHARLESLWRKLREDRP